MRKNKRMIKLFFILLLCTAFIFSSSHFGALAYENFKNDVKSNLQTTNESLNSEKPNNKTTENNNVSSKTPGKVITLYKSTVNLEDIPNDLQTFLDHSSKIDIPGKSTFSLLEFMRKQKLDKLDTDTLSLIASGIYQSILPTNFSIMERNIGNSLPNNVTPGFEAKLNFEENDDLAFTNPNQSKFVIVFEIADKSLNVTLKGEEFPYQYKITKTVQGFKPKTIMQYSPLLPSGKVKVTVPGKEGYLVKVFRDVYKSDQQINRELISSDYYPPVYRVEIHSLSNLSDEQGSQISVQTNTQLTENQSGTGVVSNNNQNVNPTGNTDQANNKASGQTNGMPK